MEVAATVDDKVIKTAVACAEQVTKLPFDPLDEETCPGTDVCSDPPSVRKFVDPFVGAFVSQYWPRNDNDELLPFKRRAQLFRATNLAVFDVPKHGTCTIVPLVHAMCVNGVCIEAVTPNQVYYGHITQTSFIGGTREEEEGVKHRYFIAIYQDLTPQGL